jgi:hypothetical protein
VRARAQIPPAANGREFDPLAANPRKQRLLACGAQTLEERGQRKLVAQRGIQSDARDRTPQQLGPYASRHRVSRRSGMRRRERAPACAELPA